MYLLEYRSFFVFVELVVNSLNRIRNWRFDRNQLKKLQEDVAVVNISDGALSKKRRPLWIEKQSEEEFFTPEQILASDGKFHFTCQDPLDYIQIGFPGAFTASVPIVVLNGKVLGKGPERNQFLDVRSGMVACGGTNVIELFYDPIPEGDTKNLGISLWQLGRFSVGVKMDMELLTNEHMDACWRKFQTVTRYSMNIDSFTYPDASVDRLVFSPNCSSFHMFPYRSWRREWMEKRTPRDCPECPICGANFRHDDLKRLES